MNWNRMKVQFKKSIKFQKKKNQMEFTLLIFEVQGEKHILIIIFFLSWEIPGRPSASKTER